MRNPFNRLISQSQKFLDKSKTNSNFKIYTCTNLCSKHQTENIFINCVFFPARFFAWRLKI